MASVLEIGGSPVRNSETALLRLAAAILTSVLVGGLLWLLFEPTDPRLWTLSVFLLCSAIMAAVSVHSGGGLTGSIIAGFSVGIFEILDTWFTEWSPNIRGELAIEYIFTLLWITLNNGRYLLPASTAGFLLGAILIHRNELGKYSGWILIRLIIALLLIVTIWVLMTSIWTYPPIGPGPK